MELFRISSAPYSSILSASGSSNRWNTRGQVVIYAGSSRSLSTLEMVVHRNAVFPEGDYKVMVISITDDDSLIKQINIKELPSDWRSIVSYSVLQEIGSKWCSAKETLLLKVPSAVIPQEYNFFINTQHPAFHDHVK